MRKIIIKNKKNENLVGILRGKLQDTLVIICHGFAGKKENPYLVAIAEALEKNNISNFIFDFSGHGESQGIPEDISYHKEVDDLKSVINYFETQSVKEFILIGHSMGGGIIKVVAAQRKIKAIISLSGVSLGKHFEERHKKLADKVAKKGVAYFNKKLFGKKFPITKNYIDSINTINIIGQAKNITCPVLLIHGSKDRVVPIEENQEFFEKLINAKKEFIIIDGAGHRYNYRSKHTKVPEIVVVVLNWLKEL